MYGFTGETQTEKTPVVLLYDRGCGSVTLKCLGISGNTVAEYTGGRLFRLSEGVGSKRDRGSRTGAGRDLLYHQERWRGDGL